MKAIILLLTIVLFSCTTERKAARYFNEHPDKLAPICAEKFPVKDSVVTKDSVKFDTLFIAGEPVILKDSFYIKGDTIVKQVTKECPKVQTVVKTEVKQVDHYIENTARIKTLEYAIEAGNQRAKELGDDLTKADNKIKHKNKVIWWLIIVVAIESVWILRKPLISIVKPLIGIPPIS